MFPIDRRVQALSKYSKLKGIPQSSPQWLFGTVTEIAGAKRRVTLDDVGRKATILNKMDNKGNIFTANSLKTTKECFYARLRGKGGVQRLQVMLIE